MTRKKATVDDAAQAAKADRAKLAKFEALLAQLNDVDVKRSDIVAEMNALMSGKPGLPAMAAKVAAYFCDNWRARYGTAYAWASMDAGHAMRVLKLLATGTDYETAFEEVKRRVESFLRNQQPFYRQSRHKFAIFASNINEFAADALPLEELAAPPIGCKHTPACASDAQHTTRINADLRAVS